jgi:VWFA-related protein
MFSSCLDVNIMARASARLSTGNSISVKAYGIIDGERRIASVVIEPVNALQKDSPMKPYHFNLKTFLQSGLVCLLLAVFPASGQQPRPSPTPSAEDVLRIDTELVQTNVMVFDRQGRFVDDLRGEQFELRVDGKPQPITFFERIATGSTREEKIRVAGNEPAPQSPTAPTINRTTRGRTVIFFIDDLHLELDSLSRTRSTLSHFIDREMNPEDQVLIASTSGQIGFLQQFTDNKAVLRAAVSRLKPVSYSVRDNELPPMTEYLALKIEHNDREVIDYYVEEYLKRYSSSKTRKIDPRSIQEMVKNRAHQVVLGMETVTTNTLASLDNLIQATTHFGGRKLVFFISDGFYLDAQKSGSMAVDKLRRITDASVRTGVVIYTIDARGLVSGQPDAANSRPVDPTGRLDRANIGEITLSQDGLHALAGDTGGRALRNTFVFDQWVTKALKETSNYYLLAWRPLDEQRGGKFKRLEVAIAGHPELTVRLPRGYLDVDANSTAARGDAKAAKASDAKQNQTIVKASETKSTEAKSPDADLRSALSSFATSKSVPTQLSVTYLDTPNNGALLTASVQVASAALSYGADSNQAASVDVAGVVLNEQGKPAASFKTRLSVKPLPANVAQSDGASVIYNYKTALAPGLYQVRAAARDERSGKVGSSQQWIEIPDLTKKQLTLSSLLIGGQVIDKAEKKDNAPAGASTSTRVPAATSSSATGTAANALPQIQFSVDKRFTRSSRLSFWAFIYNAARSGNSQPDLTVQVQVYRGTDAIVATPLRKLSTAGMSDLGRIPYGGEFALSSLSPGRYVLLLTVTDRIANAITTQRSAFEVE